MLKRSHITRIILILACLASPCASNAASTTSGSLPGASSTPPGSGSMPGASSSLKGADVPATLKPLEPYKEHHEPLLRPPESPPKHRPPIAPPKQLIRQVPAYFHPGMLVAPRGGGGWQGGDQLFNLTNSIGVFVEIIKPENENLTISNQEIQHLIEGIFNQGGINPQTLASTDQPPLPFFHFQILCYPIHKGYTVYCSGRLFESVELKRLRLDSNMTFQAITWEKQTLFVVPNEGLRQEVEKNAADIAQSFVERFQTSEQHKRVLGSPTR